MYIRFNVQLVKKLRKHLNLSQRELAKLGKFHYNTINNIENNEMCSIDLAERLASFFKCDPMQLLISEGQPPKNVALVESLK